MRLMRVHFIIFISNSIFFFFFIFIKKYHCIHGMVEKWNRVHEKERTIEPRHSRKGNNIRKVGKNDLFMVSSLLFIAYADFQVNKLSGVASFVVILRHKMTKRESKAGNNRRTHTQTIKNKSKNSINI